MKLTTSKRASEKPPLYFRRTLAGLSPADEYASERLKRVKIGAIVECEFKQPRNPGNLRRWWALCNMLAFHCEQFRAPAQVHQFLKIRSGHCTPIVAQSTGEVFLVADSIAFDELDEPEFLAVWKRAAQVVVEDVLPSVDMMEVENEVLRIVGPMA